jgi:DNA polymerase-3 subunit gamma/tau
VNDDRTVWYRKWRPQNFAEITGQDHVTRTLRNAVAAGRVAHAYLLCGPRGTGKTTTARVLAKAVNCADPRDGEPCDRCESCVAVREGRALDLVEMDAASNRGIDDIRDLRDRVGYAASGGRFKVYLIDEVHELTQQAFDALLKTLEEPPAHVIFVLATTDAHRVPATIVSRCQRFDLTRVRLPDLVARLRTIAADEGLLIDDETLGLIGRAATGSLRDGVNLMEQLVASYGPAVTTAQAREGLGLSGDGRALDLARLALHGDLAAGLALISAVRDDGVDLRRFTRDVVAQLRTLLLLRAGVDEGAEIDSTARDAWRGLAAETDLPAITRALKAFGGADFRSDPQASLPLELALAEVALSASQAEPPAPTFAEARKARSAPVTAVPPARSDEPPAASSPAPQNGSAYDKELAALSAHVTSKAGKPPRPAPAPSDVAAASEPQIAAETAESEAIPVAEPTQQTRPEGALTLAAARAHYRTIYDRLREMKRGAAHINPGDIIAVDADSITFGLPHAIQVSRLAPGSENHRLLSAAVSEVLGAQFTVHCVQQQDVEDRLRAQPTRPSHLLDEALKLGAQPLDAR